MAQLRKPGFHSKLSVEFFTALENSFKILEELRKKNNKNLQSVKHF